MIITLLVGSKACVCMCVCITCVYDNVSGYSVYISMYTDFSLNSIDHLHCYSVPTPKVNCYGLQLSCLGTVCT